MLAKERRMHLLNAINLTGSVSVEEMAVEFGVAPMTIRRDLNIISEQGNITRCHGGAVLKDEITYIDKRITNSPDKIAIAKKAKEYLKTGSVVFIDAGTTTFELALVLDDTLDLTIVTNDLKIAEKLSETRDDIIICGGTVQKNTGCIMGYYATRMMSNFTFDIGFFGAPSVNEEYDVSCPTMEKAFFKKQLSTQCLQSYLLVDSSKFNKSAMNHINNLEDYTGVITNYRKVIKDKNSKNKNINFILA